VAAAPAFQQQQLAAPVRVRIGGVDGWRLSGVLRAPDGAGDLQIAYEYYVARVDAGTAQVIFFSLPERIDALKPTFDRVRSSLVLAPASGEPSPS
jgi:hypothetical protein